MEFRYYTRYAVFFILAAFNVFITIFIKQQIFFFYIISLIFIIFLFANKYVLQDNKIIEYFLFIKVKEVNILEIKKIQTKTVRKVWTAYVYIGKKSNQVKEDGYCLVMKDGRELKLYSAYQNKNGIPLGKYLVKTYRISNENVEKYKLSNDNF